MASLFARAAYEIQTPRLILRSPTTADTEPLHKLLTTPGNDPYNPPEHGLTLEKLRARIGRFAESTARGENAWMVFVLRESHELIGFGGYNTFESVDEPGPFLGRPNAPLGKKYMTDVGIMLDAEHWRKGYGREVLCALLEYARGVLGCELFRTETGDDNEPWKALMRSAGFGSFEAKGRASYDEKLEVWVWKFDAGDWDRAKGKMKAERKWPL